MFSMKVNKDFKGKSPDFEEPVKDEKRPVEEKYFEDIESLNKKTPKDFYSVYLLYSCGSYFIH